ncbi:unnamed protein product, partial [Scytosiphon promiscuus]
RQQRELRRTRSLPAEEDGGRGGTASAPGGFDGTGRASPRAAVVPQNRFFQGSTVMATPLPGTPSSRGAMPAPPPTAPPAGLRLQMCGLANAPMSAPVTPVMVYAYPHGYMMAYPPVSVNAQAMQTPRSTRSQASNVWDPYQCVSPSGESTCAGFGRRAKETRPPSPECSPVALSSAMSVSSRESLSKPGGDDDAPQGPRSRASSVISDVIERGFYHEDSGPAHRTEDRQPPASAEAKPLTPELHAKAAEVVEDVPRQTLGGLTAGGFVGSLSGGGGLSSVEDDKENAWSV